MNVGVEVTADGRVASVATLRSHIILLDIRFRAVDSPYTNDMVAPVARVRPYPFCSKSAARDSHVPASRMKANTTDAQECSEGVCLVTPMSGFRSFDIGGECRRSGMYKRCKSGDTDVQVPAAASGTTIAGALFFPGLSDAISSIRQPHFVGEFCED